MTARARSAALAERRAEARSLAAELKQHRNRLCEGCFTAYGQRYQCDQARQLAERLAAVREEIEHWFDPGPGQGDLLRDPR